jgi:hypothetical protein
MALCLPVGGVRRGEDVNSVASAVEIYVRMHIDKRILVCFYMTHFPLEFYR